MNFFKYSTSFGILLLPLFSFSMECFEQAHEQIINIEKQFKEYEKKYSPLCIEFLLKYLKIGVSRLLTDPGTVDIKKTNDFRPATITCTKCNWKKDVTNKRDRRIIARKHLIENHHYCETRSCYQTFLETGEVHKSIEEVSECNEKTRQLIPKKRRSFKADPLLVDILDKIEIRDQKNILLFTIQEYSVS